MLRCLQKPSGLFIHTCIVDSLALRMYLERAGCDITEQDLDLLWTVLVKESSPAVQEVLSKCLNTC